MKPFDDYPGGGKRILKKMGRTNTRREDGLWLMENASQDSCAYCDVSLVDTYHHWLLLNVGHVVPARECARLGIPDGWHHSFTNAVHSCFGCSMFDNRYSVMWQAPKAPYDWTVREFITLRDRVLRERYGRIGERSACEIRFFQLNVARSFRGPTKPDSTSPEIHVSGDIETRRERKT